MEKPLPISIGKDAFLRMTAKQDYRNGGRIKGDPTQMILRPKEERSEDQTKISENPLIAIGRSYAFLIQGERRSREPPVRSMAG
jgi:hypothetical protein